MGIVGARSFWTRVWQMRNRSAAALGAVLALATCPASAVVYDPANAPPGAPANAPAAANPQAQQALDAGLAALREAEGLDAEAAGSQSPPPALKEAYSRARASFEQATQADANLAEAWNGLGYSQRKLGEYTKALNSYARALSIKPGYPEATEYRGEAYLGLNRVEDAKQAYLDLFAANRVLADKLLGAMKRWIHAQKSGSPAAADLAKWVEERSQIAAQTASLTREGASAGWR
jgi:tetratricopeptide (TPR) repeat protein